MCLLFHSQCNEIEDDPQDLGGEGNQDHPQGNTIGTYYKTAQTFQICL